jgi:hypothetical protein
MRANGKDAITHLLDIMDDENASPRDRLNAAVSASRCEQLQLMPGEPEPASVQYLRALLDDPEVPTNHRRESAAAVAYFERRSRKAMLAFDVPDDTQRITKWRRVLNGCLRFHLAQHGRWPADKRVLLGPNDLFEPPAGDPDRALNALLLPAANRHERRRRAVDDPGGVASIGSEAERMSILRSIAEFVHQRLAEFKLAG